MSFVETFSLFILHDLPWRAEDQEIKEVFVRMWTLLRTGVLYFMRFEEGQHTDDRILKAQKSLLDYAALAEKVCRLANDHMHVSVSADAQHKSHCHHHESAEAMLGQARQPHIRSSQ